MFSEAAEKQTATATHIIYFLTNQKKRKYEYTKQKQSGAAKPTTKKQIF